MTTAARPTLLDRCAGVLDRVVRIADRVTEAIVVLLFAGIVLVGGLQVFSRYLLNASLSWSEEFQRYGLIWIVFLALVIGYRRGAHLGMAFLIAKLPRVLHAPLGWMADLLWLTLGLAMVAFTAFFRSPAGLTFLGSVGRQSSAGMGVRMDFIYGCIVVGGGYLVLAALAALLGRLRGATALPPASGTEEEPC